MASSTTDVSKTTKHILIIGGGIAGKAIALFLHKASKHPLSVNEFTCAIYESYPPSEKAYLGGGLGLAPNGMAVLADLGLEEEIKKRAGVARWSRFWTEGGTQLGMWDHDGVYGENMYGMMRSTLYKVVSEALDKNGLKIEYKKKAAKIQETGDKVVVEFDDGSTAEGDYIIGADGGVKSAVRTQVFPDYPKPEFIGLNGAGGFILQKDIPPNIPADVKESMNFIFSKNAFYGFAPASDGGMMWWTNWVIPREYTLEEIRDTSDVKDHAVKLFRDRNMMYPCMQLIDATSIFVKASIFDIRSLPSWHKSHICLIGDAAHAVSPNSGQGASLALEDASLLALMLTRSTSSPEQVFAQFENSRRKRVEAIVEAGRRQKSNKTAVSTVGMWFRNIAVTIIFRLLGTERIVGKAWRYRVDWEEPDVTKVVKWWRDGKLVPT